MKLLIILSSLLLSQLSFANSGIGFSGNTELSLTNLQGSFSISCNDHTRRETGIGQASCSLHSLNNGDRQYFHYKKEGLIADELKIKSTKENGKTETKTEDFNSATGETEDTYNLWINTLFQTPLLSFGTNKLELTFLSKGKVVHTDSLVITVSEGETRTCKRSFEYSNNIYDCRAPQSYCYRYFWRNNFCK